MREERGRRGGVGRRPGIREMEKEPERERLGPGRSKTLCYSILELLQEDFVLSHFSHVQLCVTL